MQCPYCKSDNLQNIMLMREIGTINEEQERKFLGGIHVKHEDIRTQLQHMKVAYPPFMAKDRVAVPPELLISSIVYLIGGIICVIAMNYIGWFYGLIALSCFYTFYKSIMYMPYSNPEDMYIDHWYQIVNYFLIRKNKYMCLRCGETSIQGLDPNMIPPYIKPKEIGPKVPCEFTVRKQVIWAVCCIAPVVLLGIGWYFGLLI